MLTCILHLRLQEKLKSLLIHLLQTDDVGIEAQNLVEDEGPPQCGLPVPAETYGNLKSNKPNISRKPCLDVACLALMILLAQH